MAEIKISDWLCIAQEGKTIDGREIKREWIESVAKNYRIDLYQALIWCEHEDPFWRQWSANLGTVEELKTEEVNGKLRLMARLRANSILQSMNEQEQKIYSSVEILPDFPCEGSYYLVGLAATDQPASTGLSRLTFSQHDQTFAKRFVRTAPVLFLGSGKTETPKRNIDFSKFTKRENYSMTQEETDALIAELEDAKQLIIELQEQNKELIAQLESCKTAAEQAEDSLETAQEVAEDAAVNSDFSAIKKEIAKLQAENKSLSDRFSALMKKSVTQKPGIGSRNFNIDLH